MRQNMVFRGTAGQVALDQLLVTGNGWIAGSALLLPGPLARFLSVLVEMFVR